MPHSKNIKPPGRNDEVELKLELDAGAIEALEQRIEAIPAQRSLGIRQVTTTYFDTDKRQFKQCGLSLRVRNQAGRYLQSIKRVSPESAALLERAEWEREIHDEEPDLEAAADTPLKPLLSRRKIRRRIRPVFRTVVRRSTHTVNDSGREVELALDDARLEAGSAVVRFCELELELKSGERTALYAIAADLARTIPLRLGVLSKAERGYALLEPETSRSLKADHLRLVPHARAADGFRAIANNCIRQFRRNETMLVGERSVDALHQARVGLRRLRSAFSLFKAIVADDQLEQIKQELRWISGPLGRARNIDVWLKRMESHGKEDSPKGSAALVERVRHAREHAYDDVREALRSARFRGLMLTLVQWLDTGQWTETADEETGKLREMPLDRFAAGVLDGRYRKVRKRGRRLEKLEPLQRHRLRIQVKKLRYAADFFGPALFGGKKTARDHAGFMAALEELQDCLGALNDIAAGRDVVTELVAREEIEDQATFAAGQLTGAEEARESRLLTSAAKSFKHFARSETFWK